MPDFTITAPDGKSYTVTGDTAEGALSALQSHLGDTSGSQSTPLQWQGVPGADIPPPAPLAAKPQDTDPTLGGYAKAGGAGLAQGTMDLIGAPGTLGDFVNNQLSDMAGWDQLPGSQVSGQALRQDASALTGGATEYHGQNPQERILQAGTSAVPGAILLGPGEGLVGGVSNGVRYGMLPGMASEAGGQLTQGTEAEPFARLAGALAAPAAVESGVRGVNSVADMLSGLSPRTAATRNLTDALTGAGSSPAQVIADMSANPRLGPMDVNPNLQQMGQKLVAQGGAPRATLTDMVNARQASAPATVNDIYDTGMGQVPDVRQYIENLQATTRANGQQAFSNALNNAGPVDVTPVLNHIDSTVFPGVQRIASDGLPLDQTQQALLSVRNNLANQQTGQQLIDANRLHAIQSGLRTQADSLMSSANGYDRLTGAALNNVRQRLIDQIDQASGGLFRPAQQQYATDSAIQDAFDRGRTIFDRGGPSSDAALHNRPEYWQHWVNTASAPEIAAARVGSRVAADNAMNSVRNAALRGETIPEVGFNRDNLGILHGQQQADTMVRGLQDERNIADTNYRLTRGSDTANRMAADRYTEVPQANNGHSLGLAGLGALAGGAHGGSMEGVLAGAALGGVSKGAQAIKRALAISRNANMAEALSSQQNFQRAVNRPSGPLLAPTRLTDPRVAAVTAALLAKGSSQ